MPNIKGLGNFNINQLVTWDEARSIAIKLRLGPIVVGGGVKAETSDPKTSGIYTPEWLPGPEGFPEPFYFDQETGLKYYWLHFRFKNGAEGMNVGLIKSKFKSFPNSETYVLGQLASEANMIAAG